MDKWIEFLLSAWSYKLSVLPVLVTYLLFDLPAIVRRITGVAYVPIYFIFFPLGHSDRLYAQYFKEDYYYGVGASMTEDARQALRRRIQATAILSMVFATIVAPWICGFVAAFYLTPNQFKEFLWFLLIVKIIVLVWVLSRLRADSPAVAAGYSFYYVMGLYVGYLVLVWRGLTKSYDWTHSNLNTDGIGRLIVGLLDYAYVDVFINIVIVAAVTWGLTTLFTSPAHVPKS